MTRAAAAAMGMKLFAPTCYGAAATAIVAPEGVDSTNIVKDLKSRFAAVIANGQGEMKGQIFRIAHLGYFDFADLFAVIAGLEIILNANGFPVSYGTGVAAVQQVYQRAAVKPQTVAV
jgi:aspartate aminotransferase-like enzyme